MPPTATPLPPTPSPAERLAGLWEGTVVIQGDPLPITIAFYDDPDQVRATIAMPSQGIVDVPLTNVRLSPDADGITVEFDFPEIEAVWIGGLRGDTINGDFYQPNVEQAAVHATFELKRVGNAPPRQPAVATPVQGSETSRVVVDGDTVSVHYRGTLDSGAVFDSSEGREPISFTVGGGQVIPGFNAAVRGLSVGDTVTVRIEPEQAYGQRRDDLIIEIPLSSLPQGVKPGDQVRDQQGGTAIVLEITDEVVRLDANHALAGEALTFEIQLVSVR
jgi:FKBP-type peptidyl-prolyl cis-trans isomerase 2